MITYTALNAPEDTTAAQAEFPLIRQVRVSKKQKSSCLLLRIKPSLVEGMTKATKELAVVSGMDFSASILTRRALTKYVDAVARMDQDKLIAESLELVRNYR